MQDTISKYITVHGIPALAAQLDAIHREAQTNPVSRPEPVFILYESLQQKSMIKVDLSQKPYLIGYDDQMGRPMPSAIKEVFAQFLTNSCGINGLLKEKDPNDELQSRVNEPLLNQYVTDHFQSKKQSLVYQTMNDIHLSGPVSSSKFGFFSQTPTSKRISPEPAHSSDQSSQPKKK